MFALDSDRA